MKVIKIYKMKNNDTDKKLVMRLQIGAHTHTHKAIA